MIKKFFRNHKFHKKIVPIFDGLFLLRPTLFFPVWIMITVGMAASRLYYNQYSVWNSGFDIHTLSLFCGLTLISGSVFIINQIKDIEGDKLNKKLFLIDEYISVDKAEKVKILTLVTGFIFLLITNIFSLISGLILYLFWGIFYNIEPFHWKGKPILGMIANTIAGLVLFSSGWVHVSTQLGNQFSGSFPLGLILLSIPYLLCFTAVSILTTIPDIKGDQKMNAHTFPIKFGLIPTLIIALVFVMIAFIIGLYYNDPVSSSAALVSFPFYVIALIRREQADILRSIRYSVLILAFFVITIYPILLPVVFITFYLGKYYYWHRFNLHYPTFVIENDIS